MSGFTPLSLSAQRVTLSQSKANQMSWTFFSHDVWLSLRCHEFSCKFNKLRDGSWLQVCKCLAWYLQFSFLLSWEVNPFVFLGQQVHSLKVIVDLLWNISKTRKRHSSPPRFNIMSWNIFSVSGEKKSSCTFGPIKMGCFFSRSTTTTLFMAESKFGHCFISCCWWCFCWRWRRTSRILHLIRSRKTTQC